MGDFQIRFDQTPYFDAETGGVAAFDEGDLFLGPLASFSSDQVSARYLDDHSTFQAQNEQVIMARSPAEYRATLEALSGDDIDGWLATTFAPGDPLPQITNPPSGITLPNAVEFPWPDRTQLDVLLSGPPNTTWPLTQPLFSGSNAAFDGPASAMGGSTKGVTLLRRGVCSVVQPTQGIIDQIIKKVPFLGLSQGGAGITVIIDNVGISGFVSRENVATPNGGLNMIASISGDFLGIPLSAKQNVTHMFELENGILATRYTENQFQYSGADPVGLVSGGFRNNFQTQIDDTIFLQALQQGQSTAIPSATSSSIPACSSAAVGPKPPSCFQACSNASVAAFGGANVDMTKPDTWPASPDPGIGQPIDLFQNADQGWYDANLCRGPSVALASIAFAGAQAYPGINDPASVANILTQRRQAPNDDKFSNVRCNFHPTYEAPTVPTGQSDAQGNPVRVPLPTCEVVVRAKRINVLPDAVEVVFFDGANLNQVGADEFANEAFAVFLALRSQNATGLICQRAPERLLSSRGFAHGKFP